ncbi:MAG: mechanosensitive ion channel family protein [Alphaproteobacteria bacterium]|nr:mechanosensitive ion channel family protein [Alphaproteobacteria bacterium]
MDVTELWASINEQLGAEVVAAFVRVGTLVVVGLPMAWLAARAIGGLARRGLGPSTATTFRRFAWYGLFAAVVASVLRELGFDLSVLLGAAGILTVALGFASQTSASNIISGLFLLGERPFDPGDVIEIEGTIGVVTSIDLLSVKLRTVDNLYVRVPNEALVKARIVNRSRYPIRRVDLRVAVAYDSDLDQVEEVLRELALDEPLALSDPEPVFQVLAFLDSGVDLQFSVWVSTQDILAASTTLRRQLLERFRAVGIEIPFPQRVVTVRQEPAVSPDDR